MHREDGFTIIEMLVVLAIISVLAALLFPIFLTVQGKARQTACLSNLRQIGLGVSMYIQDNDGRYPFAVDPVDRYAPSGWSAFPEFQALIPTLPLIQDVLQPYSNSKVLFRCPADSGFVYNDFNGLMLNALPSSFAKFGSSYYYRTEIAARQASESTLQTPAEINVLFDGAGQWHGSLFPLAQRYNVLFADGHIKNISRPQLNEVWNSPL